MKQLLIFLFAVLSLYGFAQTPQGFNYQAVARDADGNPKDSINIAIKFSILEDSVNGTPVYSENHSTQTNQFGLFNLTIGQGVPTSGSFADINWGNASKFLKVEIDNQLTGITQLWSVPYALYAKGTSDWTKQDTFLINNQSFDVKALGELSIQSNSGSPHTAIRINDDNGELRSRISHSYSPIDGRVHTGFDVYPLTNNGQAAFRFFRSTNTTGPKFIEILQGLNTTDQSARIGVGINSYFNLDGGNFGIGKTPGAARLDIDGPNAGSTMIGLHCKSAVQDPQISSYDNNGDRIWVLNMGDRSLGNRFGLYSQSAAAYVFSVTTEGHTKTRVLEITGGDVAEARHSTTETKLLPGSVVVFDEKQQGKIRLTNKPYDRKVAGVISGAGKYFAGVCLLQEELSNGALPIAQVGTVEVLCIGPVKVGDLLTTSKNPGYAMVAADPYRAFGAIIGKATTSLKKGEKGLVEMQVEKH